MKSSLFWRLRRLLLPLVVQAVSAAPPNTATLEAALAAQEDVWGLAAMRQPNGASYEFFADLLPPLRYVNAQFRHYPIVLSAPGALQKARLVSNGSAINARAGLARWRDIGIPVSFFVGEAAASFGEITRQLDGPRYERGYLPIVQLDYRSGGAVYREEVFASVDLPDHAVVFARFNLKEGETGIVSARLGAAGPLHSSGNAICDREGLVVVSFDGAWQWNGEQKTLTAQLSPRRDATLAVAGVPLPAGTERGFDYDLEKKKCAAAWETILAGATRVEVPEPIVNAAWKSTVIGSFMLLRDDRMNYSAGNHYDVMYEAESGDAVRALLLWGLLAEGRRMIPPLLDYAKNPGLRIHDAAFKLQLLTHYYWLTRDAQFVREQKPRWSRCVEILTGERDPGTGLVPREAYCGDESASTKRRGARGIRPRRCARRRWPRWKKASVATPSRLLFRSPCSARKNPMTR